MRCTTERRGWSLVEMLGVLGVVGVLLALLLPALAGARDSARSGACLARLSLLMVSHATHQSCNGGYWLNMLPPGLDVCYRSLGETANHFHSVQSHVDGWGYALGEDVVSDSRSHHGEAFACPSVYGAYRQEFDASPGYVAALSYRYSLAFVTEPALWDPGEPSRRNTPDRWRRRVGVHEVVFPAHKVAMFESGDHHAPGRNERRLNVSFADGHADRVDPAIAFPALAVPWHGVTEQSGDLPLESPMTFSSAGWGVRGRDFQ